MAEMQDVFKRVSNSLLRQKYAWDETYVAAVLRIQT
jgi:hypothetical protein